MNARAWHLAVVAAAFGSLAAGSCREWLRYGPYPAGDPYLLAFFVSALLAGGPLVLAGFRLWRRRQRETWPPIALSGRIAAAAIAITAFGFYGVLTMALYFPLRWRIVPIGNALIAMAGSGFVVAAGALELLTISAFRDMLSRKAAS